MIFQLLLNALSETARDCTDNELGQLCQTTLNQQIEAIRSATDTLAAGQSADSEWAYRVAGDFIRAVGYLLLTWAWTKTITAAELHKQTPNSIWDQSWLMQKISIAQFGIEWLAPETHWHLQRVLKREAKLPAFLSRAD